MREVRLHELAGSLSSTQRVHECSYIGFSSAHKVVTWEPLCVICQTQVSGGSKGSVNLGDICPMGVRRSRYDQ